MVSVIVLTLLASQARVFLFSDQILFFNDEKKNCAITLKSVPEDAIMVNESCDEVLRKLNQLEWIKNYDQQKYR